MNERRATKRALLTSITALVMCVVMLAGTTFAWFTDTASTNVNKIQAGNLDVQLMMSTDNGANWSPAEGETLNFLQKRADDTVAANADILWEPGATFELPLLKIVNNGNLNIKCRVEVTGIAKTTTTAGTFDLNDAITWSATGLTLDQNFTLDTASNKEKEFTISGTMKTTAGNDYQGLSIDGVSITVYATQAEGEFDSTRNDYDKDATYTRTNATLISETDGKTVTLEAGKTYTVGTATITTDASGNITYVNSGTSGQKVTINTDGHNLTVNAPNDIVYHYGKAGAVTVTAVAGSSYHEFGEVGVLALSQGRVVVEKGDAVKILQVKANDTANPAVIAVPQNVVLDTKLEKGTGVSEIVIKTVDSNDKVVTETKITNDTATTTEDSKTVATPKELSKIIGTGESGNTTIGEAKDYVAMIGSTGYTTLPDAVAAAKDGDTITLLKDSTENGVKVEKKGFVLDLNGHTLKIGNPLVGSTGTETNGFQLMSSAGNVTFKNGTLTTEEAYILIQNYCNLTLDNMVLDGRNIPLHAKYPNRVVRYTLSNNCGNVTINNSVIYAPEKLGVAFDVCRYSSYPTVSVTVTGDSVINGDVEVSGEIGEGQSRQLTINNGMFNGKFNVAKGVPANITISGGTFSSKPDNNYIAEGYTATENSGVWTVAKS